MKSFLIESQTARNVGRERRAACSGLFIMFSQPVYSKGECISLYMVMKELSEDSVGQAVYMADELL